MGVACRSGFHQDVGVERILADGDFPVDQRVQPVGVEAQVAVLQILDAIRVRTFLRMLQHRVLRVAWMEPDDAIILVDQPGVQIIILAAPALEQVREAVDVDEGLGGDGNRTTEQAVVR